MDRKPNFIGYFPQARPEMPSENLVSLQVSLISLAFRCYPDQIILVDKVLESTLVALDKIAVEKYVICNQYAIF